MGSSEGMVAEPQAPTQPAEPQAPQTPEPGTPTGDKGYVPTTQGSEPQSPAPAEPSSKGEGQEPGAGPKATDYEIPEGMPPSLADWAASQGLSQKQLNSTINQFGGYFKAMAQTKANAIKKAGQNLVRSWADESEHNLALAKAALSQNDTESKEFAKLLKAEGLINHPAALKYFLSVGRSMREGGYIKSSIPKNPGQKTLAQAMYGPKEEN